MSAHKISASRRSAYKRPRRAIPAQNRRKSDLKEALEREAGLIRLLMSDAQVRRAFERGHGLAQSPMSVWHDSDHSWAYTDLAPGHLPPWEKLTEAMKMFIGFDLGMEFNECYAFTSHIETELIKSWTAGSHGIMKNINQRIERSLKAVGMDGVAFCYVVETRTRSGRSLTRPHLHGFAIALEPVMATRLKVALERALYPSLRRQGRSNPVRVERAYDHKAEFAGRARWVSYITKNAGRWDDRLGKRRVYMSRSFTELARLAWTLRRERL